MQQLTEIPTHEKGNTFDLCLVSNPYFIKDTYDRSRLRSYVAPHDNYNCCDNIYIMILTYDTFLYRSLYACFLLKIVLLIHTGTTIWYQELTIPLPL